MSNQERIPCTFPLSSPSSPARPTTEQNPNNSPFRTPDQTTRTIEDNLNSRNLVSHGDSSPEEVSYGSRQRLNLSDSRRRSGEILPDDISISEQETRRYPVESIQSSSTHRPNDGIASHNQRTNANNPSDYFFPPGLHQQSTSSNAPQHTGLLPTIQRFFSENTEAQTVNQTFHTQHSSSPQSTGTDQMEDFYQSVYRTSITTVLPSGRPIEMSPNYIRSLASNVHVDAPSQHPTSHPFSTDNSVQSNPQMSTSIQSSGITYYQPSVHSQNSAFRPTNPNQTPPGTYRPPPAPGAPLPFFPYVTAHSSLNSQSSPQMSAHGQILAYPSFNQPVVPHPVTKLYEQLVSGCQRSSSASSSNPVLCWNPFCASNPHSVKRSTDEISKLVTLLSGCGFVGDLYCESVKSQILSQTSLEGDRTNSVPQFQGQFVPMSFATTPDISAPNPVPSFLHLDPSSLTACLMTYQDRADLWVNREPINDSIADGLARELVWGRIYSNASMMEVVRLKQCTPDDYILELFDLMASQRTGQTSPSSQPTFLPNHIAGVVYYIFSRLDLLGKTFMVPNPSSIFSHSGGHATQVVNVEKVKLINDWVIEKVQYRYYFS
ncbi:hypothetical protein BKA69DRAFT_1040656 [Paraphysoderma sedebokerense]|nr:hypothetical protein BKA69DRAFT_1040656 [Paraphysoderma sedebokerense]